MRQSVRNPLGLFALFVTAMYAVTAIVFKEGLYLLCGAWERRPIIWFLILFPVAILGVFVFLVVKHHEKLYGPRDYRSDDAFQRITMSKRKKREEIRTLADAAVVTETSSEDGTVPGGSQSTYQNSTTDERVNYAFTSVGRPARSPRVTMEEYSRIEALAVDGSRDGVPFVVEVKYWLADRDLQPLFAGIDRFVSQARRFRRLGRSELVLIVVLDRKDSSVEDKIRAHVDKLKADVYLHVLSRDELSLGPGV